MIFFTWLAELVITEARPTSEPVPAVVGTAIIGAIALLLALAHQSPISSKSQTERVCPAMKATIFPRSSPEPPPKAMTPSWPPADRRRHLMPSLSLGLDQHRQQCVAKPGGYHQRLRALSNRKPAVTSRGRICQWSRHRHSAIRPAPKRMVVIGPIGGQRGIWRHVSLAGKVERYTRWPLPARKVKYHEI